MCCRKEAASRKLLRTARRRRRKRGEEWGGCGKKEKEREILKGLAIKKKSDTELQTSCRPIKRPPTGPLTWTCSRGTSRNINHESREEHEAGWERLDVLLILVIILHILLYSLCCVGSLFLNNKDTKVTLRGDNRGKKEWKMF